MSKVLLIGPSTPIRGGISLHTENLYNSLKKILNLKFINFKKIYPEIIYPGKSQYYQNINLKKIDGINLLNPIHLFKTFLEIKKSNKVILVYWTFFLIPFYLLITFLDTKKIILLCHNIYDHDSSIFKKIIINIFLKKFNKFIVQTRNDEIKLTNLINKNVKVLKANHPIFDYSKKIYPINFNKKINILFFGIIRKYKGLEFFLKNFIKLERKDIFLKIIGEVWYKDKNFWINLINKSKNNNISYNFNFINSDDLEKEILDSNLIILPYLEDTGTGVASLALKYNRPILGSSINGLTEIFENDVDSYLFDIGHDNSLITILNNLDEVTLKYMSENLIKKREKFTFENYSYLIKEYLDLF